MTSGRSPTPDSDLQARDTSYGLAEVQRTCSTAYETLHIAAGGQVLLPHLKQLIWTRSSADGVFPYISLFMAPDLRTFHLKSSRKSPISSTLIASLSTRYPFLSDVNITLPIESNTTSILSTTVCGWDRLRHLSISSLSKEALIHVATLSELRRFSLEHQGQVEFPTAWSNTTFPALTHLSVTCYDFLFCINLVRSMAANTVLKSVRFDIRDAPSPGFGWEKLTEALRDMHSSSSLRNINITDDDYEGMMDGEDHEEHLMIKGDRIRLLLAFAHLTRLHLYSRYGFDLDDTLIGDVARALPCLQQLSIWGGPDEGRMPRTTIACLRELAQHCKHLWRITMAFDARLVSNLKTSRRVYAARLTMLNVVGSPISDSAQVAAFLSDIFPSLRTVLNYKTPYRVHDDVTDFDLHKKWCEVESLVRVYAVVPAQETARRKPDDSDDE
ncbi:hypothetical protein Hypma_016406 [Hypsizygus marmoreus]|uniref:F-box domain-containing protein n=1 Tax=Hypsizygus marmoreus TaxID=39966 RepID=A0A369J576_HYPMA|nr:hypothetical protein Hypma_016406 [Hypsizygus marmoreus]